MGDVGFTLAQKPYSEGWIACQKFFGRLSVKLILVSALHDLKPYFQGKVSRIGPPFCGGSGLPYMPVEMNASSFAASSSARPSIYGQG